jgi:hypothetical protein
MAQPEKSEKLVTPLSLLLDLVLVVGFFVYMFTVLKSHVPSTEPKTIMLWAALTSSCITGVFWLALQMFRVVLRAQRAAKRQ